MAIYETIRTTIIMVSEWLSLADAVYSYITEVYTSRHGARLLQENKSSLTAFLQLLFTNLLRFFSCLSFDLCFWWSLSLFLAVLTYAIWMIFVQVLKQGWVSCLLLGLTLEVVSADFYRRERYNRVKFIFVCAVQDRVLGGHRTVESLSQL